MMPAKLSAGATRVIITPPVGSELFGHPTRDLPAQGVHDDLTATAIVLEQQDVRAAIISCDLAFLESAFVDDIRRIIHAQSAILPENIMISCTHTHSGPISRYVPEGDDAVRGYLDNLKYQLAGAVSMAASSLQEARVTAGKGIVNIGYNRRAEFTNGQVVDGHINSVHPDPEVGVVRFDTSTGEPIAVLVNYACHPLVTGPENYLFTADYPSQFRTVFETVVGAPCVFIQGAGGNINPIRGNGGPTSTFRNAARLGNVLAGEATKVYEHIGLRAEKFNITIHRRLADAIILEPEELEIADASLRVIHNQMSLPLQPLPSMAEAERLRQEASEQLEQLTEAGAPIGQINMAAVEARWTKLLCDTVRTGQEVKIPLEIQVMRLHDVVLVAIPGEPFVETGLAIKAKSPSQYTFIAGYSNGCVGYIPTAGAYSKGGYEVDIAYKFFLQPAALSPACEDQIVTVAVELIQQLWNPNKRV